MQLSTTFFLKLKQFYVDHVDPDAIQPLQALRTAIAAIIAIIFYRAINWPQAYWILLSTILILQTYLGNTPKERFSYLAATGLAAAVCTYIGSLCGQSLWSLALFLTISTLITLYSYVVHQNIGNAAFYLNLFCLSSSALAVDITNSWQRATCVLLGGLIAIIVCACCWPERLSQQIHRMTAGNLKRLSEFNHALTVRAHDEKAIAIRRNRIMRGLQRAHQLIPSNEVQDHQIFRKIEHLYEIILHFYQLKRFVSQQKVLRLIEKELSVIAQRITWLLQGAADYLDHKGRFPNSQKFNHSLRTFEKHYQNHLPQFNEEQFLAFTVYIDNIHKLEKTIADLLDLLEKKYHHL